MEFIQYVELLSFNFQFLGKIGTKYEVVWFHRWKFWKPENGHHIPKKHSNKSEIPCTRRRKPDRRWRPWMWRPRWAWRWGWPWCPTWRTWWSTGWPGRRGPWCSRRPRGRWSPGSGCWCWSASGRGGFWGKKTGLLFVFVHFAFLICFGRQFDVFWLVCEQSGSSDYVFRLKKFDQEMSPAVSNVKLHFIGTRCQYLLGNLLDNLQRFFAPSRGCILKIVHWWSTV